MLVDVIARYGYPFIFVAAAVEGDATLLTATLLAHRGYLRLDLVMLVAAAATVSPHGGTAKNKAGSLDPALMTR
jgi:hypothetical protein